MIYENYKIENHNILFRGVKYIEYFLLDPMDLNNDFVSRCK